MNFCIDSEEIDLVKNLWWNLESKNQEWVKDNLDKESNGAGKKKYDYKIYIL